MQVQVNTDHNIQGREALVDRVTKKVSDTLARFTDQVTRVEVHLTDASAGKSGPHEQRCVMEARLEGVQPLVATNTAGTLDESINGAVSKLLRLIDTHVTRVRERRPAFVEKPGSSEGAGEAESDNIS